jgi:hypothetical protein
MNGKPLEETFGVDGMTTPNIQGLINYYAGKGKTYVECGSYQGRTLASAAYNNPNTKVIGIDNFSWGDKHGQNEKHVKAVVNVAASECKEAEFIKADTFDGLNILEERGCKIDVFFYDAEHTHEATYKALVLANRMATKDAVFIIDDTNWDYVLSAVDAFCEAYKYKIIFQKFTDKNGSPDWWNGITVIKKITPKRKTKKDEGTA